MDILFASASTMNLKPLDSWLTGASVYALVYAKIGNFHDAEDLTQEVFINAYQKLGTLGRVDELYKIGYYRTSRK
ncbi:hypothetical protein H8E77_28650 [bacterium]|nr:hypothetical protein [bacterium]